MYSASSSSLKKQKGREPRSIRGNHDWEAGQIGGVARKDNRMVEQLASVAPVGDLEAGQMGGATLEVKQKDGQTNRATLDDNLEASNIGRTILEMDQTPGQMSRTTRESTRWQDGWVEPLRRSSRQLEYRTRIHRLQDRKYLMKRK
eukprot:superscaffoldBa00002654_g14911